MINKRWLFTKVWIVHLLVYYYTFGLYFQLYNEYTFNFSAIDISSNGFHEFLQKVLISPIGGITGIFDGFILFWIFPIILMAAIVVPKEFNNKVYSFKHWFIAYNISLMLYPILHIFQLLLYGPHQLFIYGGERNADLLCAINIGLSMGVSILFNWLFFRKAYKKIKYNETNWTK